MQFFIERYANFQVQPKGFGCIFYPIIRSSGGIVNQFYAYYAKKYREKAVFLPDPAAKPTLWGTKTPLFAPIEQDTQMYCQYPQRITVNCVVE